MMSACLFLLCIMLHFWNRYLMKSDEAQDKYVSTLNQRCSTEKLNYDIYV